MPNYYGPQRFGRGGETVRLGLALLRGESKPPRNPFLRKLALSSVQSLLFNDYLGRRLTDGLLRTVLAGDVLGKLPAGGMFVCTDPEIDQVRFDTREVMHAGPIVGRKTFPAAGPAVEREAELLGRAGLTREAFARFGKLLPGTRRHNLVYPEGLAADWVPEGVRLTMTLPAGSYATVLLREVMKTVELDGYETE
jgi:tRNA pseudouridine13 synthase